MKLLTIVLILFTYSVTAQETPSWVQTLRQGEYSLKIVNGNKYLFRTILKEESLSEGDLCAKALEINETYIKKAYPFYDTLPITVEYVFYDKKEKDCSTTVSVEKTILDKMDALKVTKEKNDSFIKNLNEEKEKVEGQLSYTQKENENLQNKIALLEKLLNKNKGLSEKASNLEETYSSVMERFKRTAEKIRYVEEGMLFSEVKKILGDIKVYKERYRECDPGRTFCRTHYGRSVIYWEKTSLGLIVSSLHKDTVSINYMSKDSVANKETATEKAKRSYEEYRDAMYKKYGKNRVDNYVANKIEDYTKTCNELKNSGKLNPLISIKECIVKLNKS